MSEHENLQSITPYLVVRDGAAAIDFYKRAFDARVLFVMEYPNSDKIMHAALTIGNSQFMLTEEMPEMSELCRGPELLGGSPVTIHLYCEDVDLLWKKAVDAGATVTMDLMNAFWGDRYGRLQDPFGHHWSLATPVEEVSQKEMTRRAQELFTEESEPE